MQKHAEIDCIQQNRGVRNEIVLLSIATFLSAFPASAFSFELLGYQLSPFRIGVILIALYIIYISLSKESLQGIAKKSRYSIFFILIWVVYAIVSIIWVNEYAAWVRHVYFIVLCLLLSVSMCLTVKTDNDLLILLKSYLLACIIQALVAYYQYFTHDYIFSLNNELVQALMIRERWYVLGISDGFNAISTLLLFGISSALTLLMSARKYKYLYMVAIILLAGIIFINQSRACMYAFLIIIIIAIITLKSRFKWIVITMVIAAVPIFFIVSDASSLFEVNFYATEGSDYFRLNIIRNGIQLLLSSYGFGVGAGQVDYMMAKYGTLFTDGVFQMHNMWLEVFVTYGILIGVLFIIFYFSVIKDFAKHLMTKNIDTVQRAISLGLLSFMVSFIIGCLALGSFVTKEWLMCAFAICIAWQNVISHGLHVLETH